MKMKFYLTEERTTGFDIHIYYDKKTGIKYFYDGTKLVPISSKEIREAENRLRNQGDVIGEKDEDRAERVERAKSSLNNETTINNALSKAKAEVQRSRRNKVEREQQEKRRKEMENMYSSGSPEPIKLSLKDFFSKEIKRKQAYSYSRFNKKYNNVTGSVIKPGRYWEENRNIPEINVYYDQSSSWGDSDVKKGNNIISVLSEYQRKKQLKINIYYFADNVTEYPPGGGGTCGKPVFEHIQKTRPENVIIMTDSDIDYWDGKDLPYITVPGGVWFIWRNGKKAKTVADRLAGNKLTKGFDLR